MNILLNVIVPLVVLIVLLVMFRKEITKFMTLITPNKKTGAGNYENPEENQKVLGVLISEMIRFIPIFLGICIFSFFLLTFMQPIWVGIITLILLFDSWTKIEEAHAGLRIVLWVRLRKGLREGARTKIPIIERIKVFSLKKQTYSFEGDGKIVVTCSDGVNVGIEASSLNENEFNLLKELEGLTRTAIDKGMRENIEEDLGIIAGQYEGSDFYKRREVMGLVINCYLRLERRPDYYIPKKEHGTKPKDFIKEGSPSWKIYFDELQQVYSDDPKTVDKINEKLHHGKWLVPVYPSKTSDGNEHPKKGQLDTLEFYRLNITRIVFMLDLEGRMPGYSRVEKLYAQEIKNFNVSKTDFTDDVKKSLEKKKVAEEGLKAADKLQEKKMEYMKQLMAAGVSADQASNDADVMVGKAGKQVITGGVPLVNLNNQQSPQNP